MEIMMKKYCRFLALGLMFALASLASVGCNTPKAPDPKQAEERRTTTDFGQNTGKTQENIKPGIAE